MGIVFCGSFEGAVLRIGGGAWAGISARDLWGGFGGWMGLAAVLCMRMRCLICGVNSAVIGLLFRFGEDWLQVSEVKVRCQDPFV